MESSLPFISVIVPLYNKRYTIKECIESMQKQDYPNYEIIIVDDGSTDGSKEIVLSIKDEKLLYFYKKNGGVSSARNYGIKKSKGEWIVFLDADDLLLKNCLSILIGTATKYSTQFAAANYYIKEGSKCYMQCISRYSGIVKHNYLDYYLGIYTARAGSCIYHKSLLENHLFNENLSRYEDGEHSVYIFNNYKISYTPIPVMILTTEHHDLSLRNDDIKRDFIAYMDFEGKSMGERLYYYWILGGVWKHYPHEKEFLDKRYGKMKWKITLLNYVTSGLHLIRKAIIRMNNGSFTYNA